MLATVQMSECLPLLSRLSGDDDWALLRTALRRAGGFSRPALPILNKMLEDPWGNPQDAARALAVFGPEAQSAIPALLDRLASSWKDTRQEAVAALRQIASEDSAPLQAGLQHPKAEIRSGVVEVLGHFPGALAAVTEALDDPSARVRLAALQSLAKLKDSAKPAIPQIRGLLQAESRTIREATASALQEIE
jgi:HEAT repeat protein